MYFFLARLEITTKVCGEGKGKTINRSFLKQIEIREYFKNVRYFISDDAHNT